MNSMLHAPKIPPARKGVDPVRKGKWIMFEKVPERLHAKGRGDRPAKEAPAYFDNI